MTMTDDDLDRIWRDGLASAAVDMETTIDPAVRVTARVRRRRRTRRTITATATTLVAAAVIVFALGTGGGAAKVRVQEGPSPTTAPPVPVAVVEVDVAPGGALKIDFPGRETGSPPSVVLPSGLIRFEIHVFSAGHMLRMDGVPAFDVVADTAGATITANVDLAPGEYVMYCAIPGHRDAGMQMRIVVVGP